MTLDVPEEIPLLLEVLNEYAPTGRNPTLTELVEGLSKRVEDSEPLILNHLTMGVLGYDDDGGLTLGPEGEKMVRGLIRAKNEETRIRTLREALRKFNGDVQGACKYLSMGDRMLYEYYRRGL